ncbi:MAG: flippase [bacterium]|nr:flippase [bacterium]
MLKKITSFLFHNTGTTQTVAKNTFWLFFGQFVSRALRAAIVIYAARVLGAEHWGAFSYALGVAAFLTIFSDIGINALITKEASRNPELKNQYLATAFWVKLALLVACIAVVITAFPYLTNIPEAAVLMPILLLVFAFDTLRDLGSALCRALEKMEVEAGLVIFTNAMIVGLGFVFLITYQTTTALAWAYAIGSGVGFVATGVALRGHYSNILKNFSLHLIIPILTTAWPFGLMGLMGAIMLNTDIIMLGWLRPASEVGYYSVAQKLILLSYVFPQLIATSIFPPLSRAVIADGALAKNLLEKSVAFVVLIAAPITIIGFLLATPIITIVFGAAYGPAIPAFRLLMLTVLIVYPSTLLGNAIFAYDKQRSFLTFVLVAIFGNAIFNLLLIPSYGILGAAAATVATQLITNALIWRKMKRVNGLRIMPSIRFYLRQLTLHHKDI